MPGKSAPLLIITAGLVGTGKSTVAEAVAERYGTVVISSDMVRKQLAGVPPEEHRFEPFDSGIYARGFSQRTYAEMFRQARDLLKAGVSVVMDASFRKVEERAGARAMAAEHGARFLAIECVASEAATKKRLDRRLEEGTSVSDGRWEIYEAMRRDFEEIKELGPSEHLVVDNSGPLGEVLRKMFSDVEERLVVSPDDCDG